MKKVLFQIMAVSLTVFLTLLLLEIGVRLFWRNLQDPIIPLSLKTHRLSGNPKLGYELIPNSSAFEDGEWYRINGDGIRDKKYPQQKQQGIFRIAAVGDSLTFGMGVESDNTWPKQLEAALRRMSIQAEVINFGVMGYDTTQMAELIESKILTFSPDMIIIGYCLNDIGILSREGSVLSQYRGYHQFLTTGISWLDGLLSHLRLHRLFKNRLYLKKTKAHTQPPHFSRDGHRVLQVGLQNYIIGAYNEPANRSRLEQSFQKMRQLTEGKIPILLAIYPELYNFESYPYREVHSEVARLAKDFGFKVLDPLADFLKHDPRKLRVSYSNLHPNRAGNAVFSRAVARFLARSNLFLAGSNLHN